MPDCTVLHFLTYEQGQAHLAKLVEQADAWFAERRAQALADFAERERIGGEQ